MNKQRRCPFLTVFFAIVATLAIIAIVAIFLTIWEQRAHAGAPEKSWPTYLAEITFEEKAVVITYEDGSEELLHKKDVPRELWSRRQNPEEKTVKIKKGNFFSDEQVFIIEGIEGRWQCSFSATSYYR